MSQSCHGVGPLTEEMRRLLRVEIFKDTCTADMVAGLYAVSRRTLTRHLKAEGRTFRQGTNEVRCEIACKLLAETDLSLRQITKVLNYSDPSAFTRAFQR
ncbi:MAG: AraC family transcriptional regulator [Microvirga sp.]